MVPTKPLSIQTVSLQSLSSCDWIQCQTFDTNVKKTQTIESCRPSSNDRQHSVLNQRRIGASSTCRLRQKPVSRKKTTLQKPETCLLSFWAALVQECCQVWLAIQSTLSRDLGGCRQTGHLSCRSIYNVVANANEVPSFIGNALWNMKKNHVRPFSICCRFNFHQYWALQTGFPAFTHWVFPLQS